MHIADYLVAENIAVNVRVEEEFAFDFCAICKNSLGSGVR